MPSRRLTFALTLAATLTTNSVLAHHAWLLPSATQLSGDDPWISVDAAISNDLFYFNHVPMGLDNLVVTAPNGQSVPAMNQHKGKYRSTFDVQLSQEGTYRISVASAGLLAQYELDGERKRWRGNPAQLRKDIPAQAKILSLSESVSRIESFVTRGAPTAGALALQGKGLELVPVTHPNDLYAGEQTTFKIALDGKPAADLEIHIIPGGTRYRDQQQDVQLKTNAQGEFSITWPEAGMYWMEAATSDKNTSVPEASERRVSYNATFEVLPQ